MPHFTYRLSRTTTASPERLFDLLSNPAAWPTWTKVVPSARWEDPAVHGPGGTRLMGKGRFTVAERVDAEERGVSHAYSMPSARFPARNYRSQVTFAPLPGGRTQVVWSGEFDGVPGVGHAYRAFLARFLIKRLLTDLVRYGERPA